MKLLARGQTIEFPRRPVIMGIVNLVADSFCGDGIIEIEGALERARELVREGAEIIDIGAESARTNREAITEEEEAAQLLRFIHSWQSEVGSQKSEVSLRLGEPYGSERSQISDTQNPPLLSINTWRPAVASAALTAGGHILNDLSALPTDENARICAETGAALLIMHSVGEPKVPQRHVRYDDIMATLDEFFSTKIAMAEAAGVLREAIILDPGLDFAKQCDDNLRILRELHRLAKFQRPLLLPISRKTFIGETLGITNPADRDAGTIACIVQGMLKGAHIFRVHNVRAARQTVRMIEAVEHAGD